MSKIKYFSTLTLFFLTLLSCAVWIDCHSLLKSARKEVSAIDLELKKQEERYLQALAETNTTSASVRSLLENYRSALSATERKKIFSEIRIQLSSRPFDASDPTQRRLIDQMNGALNRLSLLEQPYSRAIEEYLTLCKSWKGQVAGCLP